MLAVLSSYGHILEADSIKRAADAGFNAVNMYVGDHFEEGQDALYADRIRTLADLHRACGLKFFMRWPTYSSLNIANSDNCYQNWQGGKSPLGVSCWSKDGLARCLRSLECLQPGDVDGLLVSLNITDCPMPLWEPQEGDKSQDLYWCHDPDAKADWQARCGDIPMPCKGGDEEPEGFYEWYQEGMLRRYDALSEAALRIAKQLLMWFTPSLGCRTSGQPGLEVGLEKWRQKVLAAGGKEPIFVTMSLFPFQPWGPEVFDKVREVTNPEGAYRWRCIGGIMHANTPDALLLHLKYNARKLAELGMVGFSTGLPMVSQIPEKVRERLVRLRKVFREDFD